VTGQPIAVAGRLNRGENGFDGGTSAVRVAGIEGGVECASFALLLSALAIPLSILACGRRARLVAVDPGWA
jgi:hypothetical protein